MDLLPMILNMGAFLTTLILCRLYKFASLFEFLKYLSHFIRRPHDIEQIEETSLEI